MPIPLFQLGRHLVSVVLTPQTIGTAGALSDGTPVTLTTVMSGLDESLTGVLENVSALNATRANNMKTEDDFEVTFRILKVNNSSDPNPLVTAMLAADVFKYTYTEGTGGSAKTTTAYGQYSSMRTGFQGKGGQIAELTLNQVDNGTATYVRS